MEDNVKLKELCCGCLDNENTNYFLSEDKSIFKIIQNKTLRLCEKCQTIIERFDSFAHNIKVIESFFKEIIGHVDSSDINIAVVSNKQLSHIRSNLKPVDLEILKCKNKVEQVKTSAILDEKKGYIKMEPAESSEDEYLNPNANFEYEISMDKEDESKDDTNDPDYSLNERRKPKLTVRFKKTKKRELKKSKTKESKRRSGRKVRITQFNLTLDQFLEERNHKALREMYLKSVFKCTNCVKGFNYKETYDEHMMKHHESSGPAVCDLCSQRFQTEDNLNQHLTNHFKRFRCMECGQIRTTNTASYDHYNSAHSMEFTYTCKDCGKSYLKKRLYRRHVKTKHTNIMKEQFICDYCKKSCATKMGLRIHISNKHLTGEESKLDRPFQCMQCSKTFKNPRHLKVHQQSHDNAKEFYCVECDRYFKTAGSLKTHLGTTVKHAGLSAVNGRFQCQYCEARFFDKRTMQTHLNRDHLNIKPHICELCFRSFLNSESLRFHKKKKHTDYKPVKNIPCPMCQKVFQSRPILRGHLRTHTGERPFTCDQCTATFTQSGSLHNHKKLVHLKIKRMKQEKRIMDYDKLYEHSSVPLDLQSTVSAMDLHNNLQMHLNSMGSV